MTHRTPSPLPMHASPGVGFDEPFELLNACHDRVRQRLALLARLLDHLAGAGADAQALGAAADVMRYFDQAAPHHHEDEERHLAPALRQAGRADLAERMLREHGELALSWGQLRALLADLGQADARQLASAVQDFTARNEAHLALEDDQLYPEARRLISPTAWPAMGDEMARRRGAR